MITLIKKYMQKLSNSIRFKLSVMMFLQYAYYGVWIIPFASFLQSNKYTNLDISNIIGNTAIAFILAPLFVCMLTDKFFKSEKILSVLNITGAILLLLAAKNVTNSAGLAQPLIMWWIILIHCIFYTPTWALTNNIAMRQMSNPERDFSSIRIMGTIGWIIISAIALFSSQITQILNISVVYEKSNIPLLIGSVLGIAAGFWALCLPATPPEKNKSKTNFSDIFGISALKLLKNKNFLIISVICLIAGITDIYYWAWCNLFLTELNIKSGPAVMALGQMTELVTLMIIAQLLTRLGTKKTLFIGIIISLLRFTLLSLSYAHMLPLSYLGVSLHGTFFVLVVITSQIYINKKSPKNLMASAQGLLSMLTFGIGWFLGAHISGYIVEKYQLSQSSHNWSIIWLYPLPLITLAFFILFLFKEKSDK